MNDLLADLFTVFGFAALFILGTIVVDRFWALVDFVARAYCATAHKYERVRGRQRRRNYELAARAYRPQARSAPGSRTALPLRWR